MKRKASCMRSAVCPLLFEDMRIPKYRKPYCVPYIRRILSLSTAIKPSLHKDFQTDAEKKIIWYFQDLDISLNKFY